MTARSAGSKTFVPPVFLRSEANRNGRDDDRTDGREGNDRLAGGPPRLRAVGVRARCGRLAPRDGAEDARVPPEAARHPVPGAGARAGVAPRDARAAGD